MQLMIVVPFDDAHEPPPPPGDGDGDGLGAGAAGVRNTCVAVHGLVVSPSLARARQNMVAALVNGDGVNLVCPAPSPTIPAATRRVNA